MKIKDRLALYFTLISTLILLCVLFAIYFTFLKFMQAEFFSRLTDRTMVTAKLYLEADEISSDSLSRVREQYLEKLNGEVIRIYNDKNDATFIGDDQQYWNIETIEKVRHSKKLQFREGLRQVVGIYYKDNQGDFVILASAIDQSTINRVEKLWKIMVVTFLTIFIGLLLSVRWIAKRILLPLNEFIEQVKLIKSNNLHFRVNEGTNKDEVHLLAQNFNNLMEHLEQSFILQKTFVANASHELRTPITRMIIGAEISLSQERSKEDYQRALHSVLEDAEKLENIISSLLNLAQTDLEYGETNLIKLRIDEMIWSIQEEWTKKPGNYQLLVEVKDLPMEEELMTVSCNPTLLQIALDNIISNAFKFSDQLPVRCILEINETGIHIFIVDQGVGMEPQQLDHIFKPFYSSSSKTAHAGNGMGLYMAYKIVTLYKGNITVKSQKDKGTIFEVFFPKF
jgi:signal transduction histidine kinase